jgi:acetyl esterase/lipase
MELLDSPTRGRIESLGRALGPDVLASTRLLFDAEQQALASRVPALAVNVRYGPGERNLLDAYSAGLGDRRPVLLFVHGGGFLAGDKGDAQNWANAAVGRAAAEAGFLGVVMTYRLAPDHGWPAGGEDVGRAIDWLRANAATYGGDPERIVLLGTSAGAVHLGTYLQLRPHAPSEVRGVALLSGLYGYTPLEPRDTLYYGDTALYSERMPRRALATTGLPLFLACAEFDPPRFQAEFLGLMQERLDQHGAMPRGFIGTGHNHYSLAMHLGTSDKRLAEQIVEFVKDVT